MKPAVKRAVTHASFTIERAYAASPARVFGAWATLEGKQQWFRCHEDWVQEQHTLDFRVGGREISRVKPKGEPAHVFEATFHDIVPNERIIFAYNMALGERLISVSLTAIEFKAARGGTRMTFTEHGAFLDGYDGAAEREEGTRIGLSNLDPIFGVLPAD